MKTFTQVLAGLLLVLVVGYRTESGDLNRMLVLALLAAILLGACLVVGRQAVPIVGLIFSAPLGIVHHFTYLPDHTGTSNGLTVDVTDLWAVWLFLEYGYARWKGTAMPAPALSRILLPMALLLFADTLSLWASSDITLSLYGLVYHAKLATIFLIVVLTIAQGKDELRAASLGIVLAVLTIGGICVVESILGVNFRANADVDEMTARSVFRAAGLNTPTLTAGYLAVLLPLVCIELTTSCGGRKRLAAASLCIGLAGLVTTLTRGALGFLMIGSIPLVAYLLTHRRIRPRHIVLCLGGAALAYAILEVRIAARLNEGDENLTERAVLIKSALNMAAASPIVGAGLNTYELHMFEALPKDESQDWVYLVHNEYAMTLAETGPLGLLALLWLLASGLRRAARLARLEWPLGVGLLCSMIVAVLDMNLEGYTAGPTRLSLWIIMAMISGMWSAHRALHPGLTSRVRGGTIPLPGTVSVFQASKQII